MVKNSSSIFAFAASVLCVRAISARPCPLLSEASGPCGSRVSVCSPECTEVLAEAHFLSLRHPATPVPLWGTQSTPPLPLKHRASLPNAEAGLSRTRRTFPGSAVSLAVRSEPPPCSSLSTLSCSVILCLSVTFRKQLVSSDITAPRWGPSGQLESVVWEHHTHPLATAGSRCQSRAPAGSRAPPPPTPATCPGQGSRRRGAHRSATAHQPPMLTCPSPQGLLAQADPCCLPRRKRSSKRDAHSAPCCLPAPGPVPSVATRSA